MELSSSDKERIQHQYDALAKKTLVGEAKSYRRTLAKRAAREVTFSDLSESELAHIHTHFIVNSVNYENGHKLQWSKHDLKGYAP